MFSITFVTRTRTLATITTPSREAARLMLGALSRSHMPARAWFKGQLVTP